MYIYIRILCETTHVTWVHPLGFSMDSNISMNIYIYVYIDIHICIDFFKRMHQQMHTSWYGSLLKNHPTLKHRTEHTYTHAHTFKEKQISRLRPPAPLKHRTSTNKPKMSKLDRSSFDVKTSSAEFSAVFAGSCILNK